MTTKQHVIERMERLPETASLADFREELEIIAAIEEAQRDATEGKVKTVDQAKAKVDSWFTK
jgi:hypothetical protein